MQLHGLNEEQMMIADLLWACESVEEYRHILEVLDERQRMIAMTLATIMHHEHLEETLMAECDYYESYPDAEEIINHIRRNYDERDYE
jgi:hypothetical protein